MLTIWHIDPIHTHIRFETKYLLISSISGWFREFEGTVSTKSDDFNASQIELTIYTNSLDTGNEERDNHLRSVDFFDSKKNPTLTFTSTSVVSKKATVNITGNLKIKDVTDTIKFKATYLGNAKDSMGNVKAGFQMSIRLNRKDFNISWNNFFDKAGLLLADEVTVFCEAQLLKVP